MHKVLTRPWHWKTIVIVIVVVLAVPIALLAWGYKGEFSVSWPLILGVIGITLALGTGEIVKLWKPAMWVVGITLLVILIAVSLLLEPQGKLTFHPNMLVYTSMAVFFWLMGRKKSSNGINLSR